VPQATRDVVAHLDQLVQAKRSVHVGLDAHPVQHEDDVFSGHVARGASGIRATAQTTDRAVDHRNVETCDGEEDVGESLAVRVVEVHR